MTKKNIIIAGAGFGGITAALKLCRKLGGLAPEYEITLLNRRYHHLYTPALYEIAAIPLEAASDPSLKLAVMVPIADIVEGRPIRFLCDELVGVNKEDKKILLQRAGEMPYEFLVLALGSETNYFNIPGLPEYSFPLKTFEDALRLRQEIEGLVQKQNSIKILVGGGGSSGVELAAEFVNFVCKIKERVKGGNHCEVEYILVEGGGEILPGFDSWIIKKAQKRLEQLGILIKTGKTIASARSGEVTYKSGETETFDILVWTGGVKGPSVLGNFGFPLSPKGAVEINEYLQVKGLEDSIFAIGDNSSFINPKTGKPLIWNVPAAEAEGRIVAKNIIAKIKNLPLQKFKPMGKYPFILAVGRKYAIADLVFLRLAGILGWCLKQLVELRYLLFILPFRKAIDAWLRAVRVYMSND